LNGGTAPQEQTVNKRIEGGVLTIDNADGTTTIDFNPSSADLGDEKEDKGHGANLAKKMSTDQLELFLPI